MQTHGGAEADAAIRSAEREVGVIVEVDWHNNGQYDHPLSKLQDYVSSITTDRSLSGSAPEEILLVEGTSVAELRMTISGEYAGQSMAAQFSPFNTRSAFNLQNMVGSEIKYSITVETPLGRVEYPQFIGHVRTITPNRADNTVEITALDRSELLRKNIQLPPWAVSDEHIGYGEVGAQSCWTGWVIDHCLKMCDISHGAKRPAFKEELGVPDNTPDGVMLYVSANDSYLPTIGYLDNLNAWTFANTDQQMFSNNGPLHPDAPAGTNKPHGFAGLRTPVRQRYGTRNDQGILRYWATDQDLINPAGTHYLGFTINTNGYRADDVFTIADFVVLEVVIGWAHVLQVHINAGKVRTSRHNGAANSTVYSPWVTIPQGQEHVDVFIQWDCTLESGSRVYVRAGTNSTPGWVSISTPMSYGEQEGWDQVKGRVTIGQAVNLSDIFYSTRNYYGADVNETWNCYQVPKYHALLDYAINRHTNMPDSKPREALSVITAVTASEFGASFFQEDGVFRFLNRRSLDARAQNPVRDFTMDEVEGLTFTHAIDSVRNIVVVEASRKRAVFTPAMFKASDPFQFYVPGRTERYFRIWRDDILSPLTFFLKKYMSTENTYGWPVWKDDVSHGYCIQYEYSDGWKEDATRTGVEATVYFSSLGYVTVRIWNGWNEAIRLAKGTGGDSQPAFHFAGTQIFDGGKQSITFVDRESVDKYGANIITLSGEWFHDDFFFGQDYSQATAGIGAVATNLLRRARDPVPATDAITVPGDPRLQLTDAITIKDPSGFGNSMNFMILGINRTFDKDSGLIDTLTVESTQAATGEINWQTLELDNANWAAVEARYPTWADLEG